MTYEAQNTKHGARALVMAGLVASAAAVTLAMPTKQEFRKAEPLVAELMAPEMTAFKEASSKEKAAAAVKVADASAEFAKVAETEAAKFLLLKGAVSFYTRGEAYDKAADVLAVLLSEVKDVPPAVVAEIAGKATGRISETKAPRLFALYRKAKLQVRAAGEAKSLAQKLKKVKSDALQRRYAEALAVSGDWKKAYGEFAKLNDAKLKAVVEAEANGMSKNAESGEFWWTYETAMEDAEDIFKAHAAAFYRQALAAGEITGLKKAIVEQRIKEYGGVVEVAGAKSTEPKRLTYSGYLPRVNTQLWDGVSVDDIQSFEATFAGRTVGQSGRATGYVVKSGKGWKFVQFQYVDGIEHLKCVYARFEQKGGTVRGYVEKAMFASSSIAIGTDFATIESAQEMPALALADDQGGYGIKDLVVTVGGRSAAAIPAATTTSGSIELKTGGDSPFTVKGNEATLDLGGKYGKLEFVKCPAGTVKMMLNTEGKTKRVKISRPFWITKTPILQDNALISPAVPVHNKGNYACLSRKEADNAISAINDEYGESLPKGMVVRLATLAELEYAYHANTHDRNDPYYDALHCHAYDDVGAKIHKPPRGKTVPNAWGLYDFADGLCLDKFNPASVIPFGAKDEESVKAGKSVFQARGLPDIEKEEDPLYWTDVQNAVNVSRNFLWARWYLVHEGTRACVGGVRLVIGPDLVSEWKAKNGKK